MKNRSSGFGCLCVLLGAALWAQAEMSGNLTGRVLYTENNAGATNVLVKLLAPSGQPIRQALTNVAGRFDFYGLPEGTFTLEVSEEGYEVVRARVILRGGFSRNIMILLQPKRVMNRKPSGGRVSVEELKIPSRALRSYEKGMRELYGKHRAERSLRHFRRAIELYPEYAQAFVQLGLAHAELNDYPQAQQLVEKAAALNPKDAYALTLIGVLCRLRGRPEKALAALEKAIVIEENDWLTHKELGAVLLGLGREEEAYRHASRAHELNPEKESVQLLFYSVCIKRFEYETALAELDEFLSLHPQSPLVPRVRQEKAKLRRVLEASNTKK